MDTTAGEARPSQRQPFHRVRDLVAPILKRAKMPWVELRVTRDGPAVVRVRAGSLVYLVSSEGAGKSSLLLQMGTGWARDGGVFIYFTVELDEEEAAGRVVSQHARVSWEDALRGNVPAEKMAEALDLPGLAIIAGEDAELSPPASQGTTSTGITGDQGTRGSGQEIGPGDQGDWDHAGAQEVAVL